MIVALAVSLWPGAAVNARARSWSQPVPAPTCTPYNGLCFNLETVDYNSTDNNYITGINATNNIVGAYTARNTNINYSFKASPFPDPTGTGYGGFTTESYNGESTFLLGLDNGSFTDSYFVGYAEPAGCNLGLCNTVGVILHNGSWTKIQDPSQGTGVCANTAVTGMNDSQIGVGFYDTGSASPCPSQAFEFYCPAEGQCTSNGGGYTYVDLKPSPSPPSQTFKSTTANGINALGDVVGTATLQNGHTLAWYYSEFNSYIFTNKSGATDTEARGVNFSDPPAVVGDYIDSAGATHGFLVKHAEHSPTAYDSIIDYLPGNPKPDTVVNSISLHWFISGWSQGAGGTFHGFVGTCTGTCTSGGAPRLKARVNPRSHKPPRITAPQ